MPDYEVYWRAGVRALAAEPLYREEDAHFRLKYLPAFAVLFIPAGLLPLTASKAVWFAVSVGLIPILIALSLTLPAREPGRRAARRADVRADGEVLWSRTDTRPGEPALRRADRRRCAAMMEGRKAACGLLVALAVVIKPYAVMFLPWLLAQRERARSMGGRGHRRRVRPAGSALRRPGHRRAAPGLVADRDRIDRAEPAQRRQRVARGDVRQVAGHGPAGGHRGDASARCCSSPMRPRCSRRDGASSLPPAWRRRCC